RVSESQPWSLLPTTVWRKSSVSASDSAKPRSRMAAGETASSSGSCWGSGRTQVKSAPRTWRGPSSSRVALWLSAGVGKRGSGGRDDVKCHDLGRAARVTPSSPSGWGEEDFEWLRPTIAMDAALVLMEENEDHDEATERLQGPRNCW